MNVIFTMCIAVLFWAGCHETYEAKPRPRQYPYIDFPDRGYKEIEIETCPFHLEVPEYATTQKKDLIFDENPGHPCWFDLQFEQFKATVHLSYYPLTNKASLDKLVDDAYTMAGKHNVRATFREEISLRTKHGSEGMAFVIEGPVASPYQFYLTDSKKHFLRGSLYFDTKVNRDSTQVVIDFLQTDIEHALNTIEWQ